MDIDVFFDEYLPAVLNQRPEDFNLDGRYVFLVRGELDAAWTLDLHNRPPVCRRGEAASDCVVEASRSDFQTLIHTPDRARDLFYQDRLSIRGSLQLAGQVPDIVSLAIMPVRERGLEPLVAPLSRSDFLEHHWPNEHAVMHGAPERLGELTEAPELRDVFTLLDIWKTAVRLDKRFGGALAAPDIARSAYRDHRSPLNFDGVEHAVPALKPWLTKLRNELALPVNTLARAIVYATPVGAGTAMHFDQNVNFVVQLRGRKEWRIARNRNIKYPTLQYVPGVSELTPELRSYLSGELPTTMPADSESILLERGSVLFLPRGYWHETHAHTDSLQLNFNFNQPSWAELVTSALYKELVRYEEWRDVALGAGSGNAERRESARCHLDRLLSAVPALVQRLDAQSVTAQLTPTTTMR